MEQFLRRENIKRYRKLLREADDEAARRRILLLLQEEEQKTLGSEIRRSDDGPGTVRRFSAGSPWQEAHTRPTP